MADPAQGVQGGAQGGAQIIQWILDTRDLWPAALETRQLESEASRAMALLTAEERVLVLRYFHVRDAKMALGSHLLKRYVVSRFCRLRWRDATAGRNERTKPVYLNPATGRRPLDFNVSHQAGLVALVAAIRGDGDDIGLDVGVDVVSPSERRDRDRTMVRADGWPHFVDMHGDVLADSEVADLKRQILADVPGLPPGASPDRVLDYSLRCFYALWCLREAYIKMTGHALLADWLKSLEFRHVVPPAPTASLAAVPLADDNSPNRCHEVVDRHDIWFRGKPVASARVRLQALGPDYMCCTAVRATPHDAEDDAGAGTDGISSLPQLGHFEMLSLDEILLFAESNRD